VEAGAGLGFQRNKGGPATVAINKVIFSKGDMRTITFNSGVQGLDLKIDPIKIPNGRTIGFSGQYIMPYKPKYPGHTFEKWMDGAVAFDDGAAITADKTLTATWTLGETKVDMKLDLNPANWGTLPPVPALTGGSPSYNIPSDYATTVFDAGTGKLTITFDGRNRQRAAIPLTAAQVYELMAPGIGGVTVKITGTVTPGTTNSGPLVDGNNQPVTLTINNQYAGFRLHLANAAVASNWNGTKTANEYPLTGNTDPENDHMTQYLIFSSYKATATLGYLTIQAMFRDSGGEAGTIKSGFPSVIIEVSSITVEKGDTTATP